MRQQLRARVILPVAVLGLLGAGVGAFAYGKPPADDTAAFVTTHAKKDPAAAKPGPVPAADWVTAANGVCSSAAAPLRSVGRPTNPESAAVFLAKVGDVETQLAPALEELGWPKGRQQEARALARTARTTGALFAEFLVALRGGDTSVVSRLRSRATQLDAEWRALSRKLGATECAKATFQPGAFRVNAASSAAVRLEHATALYPAVVVVLYAPAGGVDNVAVREARAGAVASKAGFVAVNVKKNSAVTKLYERYGAKDAPAVLVFVRGPKLVTFFNGFADRETVAQAVSNALR